MLLECATFQPTTVRRSAKRHALHTESSHRFERGTDVSVVGEVIDRAAALIAEVGGGTVLKGRVDAYPVKKAPRQVKLRIARVAEVLGVAVPAEECAKILTSLGFKGVGDDLGGAARPRGRVHRGGPDRGDRPDPRLRVDPRGACLAA